MSLAGRLGRGVQRATPDDMPDLLAFHARHYGPQSRQVAPDSFTWRFARNPFNGADGPEIWLCRRDDRVVGAQAGLPFRLHMHGRDLRAQWAIDLMVAPEWRLRGIAPALIVGLSNAAPVTAGLGIADEAHRALKRAGWHDLGNVPRWWRLLAPLPGGIAGSRARWASWLAAPALRAADAALAPLLAAGSGVRLVPVAAFDERVEAIWRSCRGEHPVLAVRDHAALRWRFDQGPGHGAYRRFLLLRRGRPLGYFVLRVGTVATHGLRRALLVDFLCPRRWQPVLFAQAVRAARREGVSVLQCLCPAPAAGRALAAIGFLRRPGQRLMLHLRPDAEESCAMLTDPAQWFVTFADSDMDHLPVPEERPR